MIRTIYYKFCKLSSWNKLIILFIIFFPFRFVFGICSEFWFEDEVQCYLIGLKYYSTLNWPYFGADVVYTGSQIPGALMGLLIGLPFFILNIPEAPYLLLNLITFLSLFLLGHYILKYLLPETPEWFLWPWIFTAPWVLNFSTHILNPSYVLPVAILFFISFMEVIPVFRKNFINVYFALLLMGFSMLWIFQFHMSWVLLPPFVVFALISFYNKNNLKSLLSGILYFAAGCFISGVFVIPTFIKYGLAAGMGNTGSNIVFNVANFKEFFTVLLRLFSFACFELTRFMGSNTHARLDYLIEYIWFLPFIIFAGIVGVFQVVWMIIAWFRKNSFKEWKAMKILIFVAFLMTWFSFFFSVKGPSSHTYYIMFPIVMIYSFYCWQSLFRSRRIKVVAILFLFSATIFQITLINHNYLNRSMYLNREKPLKAIQQRNYHLLGQRRSFDRNE